MHEVDNDTWSRSMVATLGMGIVDASQQGWIGQSRWCHLSTRWCHLSTPSSTRRFEAKLPSKIVRPGRYAALVVSVTVYPSCWSCWTWFR